MTTPLICGVGPLGFALGSPLPEAEPATPRTSEQARAWLSYLGITIAHWAREHRVSEPLVREILAGRKKCLRGQSHNIAVMLGMKHGEITTRPARVTPVVRAERASQPGAAA